MEPKGATGLPANAYTKLKPGEAYEPIVGAAKRVHEVTFRSAFWGLLLGAAFSAGTTFLTLKIAQGMEAAIPIAIIAVGLSLAYRRRSTILENVIIQSIGSAAPAAAAGIVFVVPALYILKLDAYASYWVILFSGIAGGFLGIVYLIPFRRHYVSEMHGKYPFPEATAITEVLVAGEEGGRQARVLAYSFLIGGAYDFISMTLGGWREVFTTRLLPSLAFLTDKLKLVFDLNTGAAVIGMGYIIGIRYCMILAASSLFSFLVLVPLFAHLGAGFAGPGGKLIGTLSAGQIFAEHVRFIGIGVIAMAAILGVFKSLKIMARAIAEGVREIFHGHPAEGAIPRTARDMRMAFLLGLLVAVLVAIVVYFRWQLFGGTGSPTALALASLVTTAVVAFLFTTVAIWTIAVTARNPISGMTIVTLGIIGAVLTGLGLAGKPGMAAAIIVGAIVCVSLAVSGQFITDLKVGYWIGSTPRSQERWKFVGIAVGMIAVAAVVILLNQEYGFAPDSRNPLPAPQANAMAAVVQMVMGDGEVPWMMYGMGALLAVIFEMMGIPTLAVGLGMYLPMHLNMSVLVGGVLAHAVSTSGKAKGLGKRRGDKGTLIASGFIAGGALMGVVGALLTYIQRETGRTFLPDFGLGGDVIAGNILSLAMAGALCIFILWDTLRVKGDS